MNQEHNVSIFVFRSYRGEIQYLLVKRAPRDEFEWNPLNTPLRPEETIRRAAIRVMKDFWSAPEPRPYIDLKSFDQQSFGEFELVDWAVGYGVPGRFDPASFDRSQIDEIRWEPLASGFQLLPNATSRQALFRLHMQILGQF